MSGEAVETLIEKSLGHGIDLEPALAIAKGVCRGPEIAHSQGIVHRYLTPGNVWSPGPEWSHRHHHSRIVPDVEQ